MYQCEGTWLMSPLVISVEQGIHAALTVLYASVTLPSTPMPIVYGLPAPHLSRMLMAKVG